MFKYLRLLWSNHSLEIYLSVHLLIFPIVNSPLLTFLLCSDFSNGATFSRLIAISLLWTYIYPVFRDLILIYTVFRVISLLDLTFILFYLWFHYLTLYLSCFFVISLFDLIFILLFLQFHYLILYLSCFLWFYHLILHFSCFSCDFTTWLTYILVFFVTRL